MHTRRSRNKFKQGSGRSSLKLLRNILILSVVCLLIAFTQKNKLPELDQIHTTLQDDPQQTRSSDDPFEFEYLGRQYLITPVADYRISGLLVTHNNPQGIADIYHDWSAVDIRDFCLVWGENVESDVYQRVDYWSNTWTCHFRSKTRSAFEEFRLDQLSNSHLLVASDDVRDTIFSAVIGDQVSLTGMLVNYVGIDQPHLKRNTSTIREDTGNGACEVVFVEEAKILRRANQTWRTIYSVARFISLACLILIPIVFVYSAQTEYRRVGKDLKDAQARRRGRK